MVAILAVGHSFGIARRLIDNIRLGLLDEPDGTVGGVVVNLEGSLLLAQHALHTKARLDRQSATVQSL